MYIGWYLVIDGYNVVFLIFNFYVKWKKWKSELLKKVLIYNKRELDIVNLVIVFLFICNIWNDILYSKNWYSINDIFECVSVYCYI